ncbi:MAG: hypothetical protein V8R55_12995 [Dysosmobacter sp.]
MTLIWQAVFKAVQAAGIPAARAFWPGRMPRLKGPVAALSLRKSVQTPAGFGGYLGLLTDEQEQGTRTLYGMRLEARAGLYHLYAAYGHLRGGRATGRTACTGAFGGDARRNSPGELRWEAVCWEKRRECFRACLEATVVGRSLPPWPGEEANLPGLYFER